MSWALPHPSGVHWRIPTVAPGDQNRRTTATREATGDSDRCRGGLFPVVFPAKNQNEKGTVTSSLVTSSLCVRTSSLCVRASKVWLSFSESYPYAAWLRTVLARVQTHPLRCYREPAVGKTPSWKSAGRTLPWSRLLGENHRSRVPVKGRIPLDIAGFRLSSPHSSRQGSA